jgi:hypothetical protein
VAHGAAATRAAVMLARGEGVSQVDAAAGQYCPHYAPPPPKPKHFTCSTPLPVSFMFWYVSDCTYSPRAYLRCGRSAMGDAYVSMFMVCLPLLPSVTRLYTAVKQATRASGRK